MPAPTTMMVFDLPVGRGGRPSRRTERYLATVSLPSRSCLRKELLRQGKRLWAGFGQRSSAMGVGPLDGIRVVLAVWAGLTG